MISWRQCLVVALILIGIVAFVAVGQLINRWQPMPEPRPGWQVIRPPHEVSALAEQADIIWAGGQEGVFALDRNTGALLKKLELGVSLEYVRALLMDRTGVLWVGHQAGLTRYDGSVWTTYTEADGLPDKRVNALLQDREGRLWAGTWGGAAIYDGQGWDVLTANHGLAANMVNVMLQDREGGLWFGSYVAPRGGISYLKDGMWQRFSTENGLLHNNVNALIEDNTGSVWAGTGLLDRGGACRFSQAESGWAIAQVLTQDDGLAGAKVRSIFLDRDGVLWFGSEYDGLARFDGSSWRVFTEADGLAAAEVKVMLQDVDGNLWLGTPDGVTRISALALASMHAAQD
jgi:ligand-binding sensor domain-containing protein